MPVIARPDDQLWKMLGVDIDKERKKKAEEEAARDREKTEDNGNTVPDDGAVQEKKRTARKGKGI